MKEIKEQTCPLCDSDANYYGVDGDNLKYFECPKCTKYLISTRAETLVLSGSTTRRADFAGRAPLAPDGQVLLIIIPPPSPDSVYPRDEVSGSFAPKSEFRL